jgi:hypothetical protein
MLLYATIKSALADDTGFANIVLHIHGGLLIFLLARLISGRQLGTFVPFAWVLVLELLNEGIDRVNHGAWRWDDTVSDIVNTLFWPFVLSLAIRLRPTGTRISSIPGGAGPRSLLSGRRGRSSSTSDAASDRLES